MEGQQEVSRKKTKKNGRLTSIGQREESFLPSSWWTFAFLSSSPLASPLSLHDNLTDRRTDGGSNTRYGLVVCVLCLCMNVHSCAPIALCLALSLPSFLLLSPTAEAMLWLHLLLLYLTIVETANIKIRSALFSARTLSVFGNQLCSHYCMEGSKCVSGSNHVFLLYARYNVEVRE